MSMFCAPRSIVTTAAFALLTMACGRLGSAEQTGPEVDPTAAERIRAMSDYLSKQKGVSVDVAQTMTIKQGKEERSYSDERHVVIEQPNRLALTASGDSEGNVVCDGKQLFAYLPSANRYLLHDAPGTIAGLLEDEAALLMGAGRTAVQLAAGDSYAKFIASATKVATLEPERVDEVDCDQIEISRQNAKIFLWIEQGEHPLLRKMNLELQLDTPDADFNIPTQIVTFSNWKLDDAVAAETFAINAPEDAEHVDTFRTPDSGSEGPHPLVGQAVPDCELSLLDGGRQKLAELKDKQAAVIDFWALWCGPCIEALPSVDKVAAKFADRDVVFFAVNLGDEPEGIREFLKKQKLKLPIAIDRKSEIGELFQADSIPMTIIVDKQGVVQVVHVGFSGNLEQTLSDDIEAVLAGKQLAKETLQAAREARRFGKPIPTGDDAVTAVNVTEDELAFNLRTSVDAYQQVGSRNDAWDDKAIEFLTEAARHFSSAKGCKLQLELVELAEPLVELGCDDPLVMYCHGAMLQDGPQDAASQSRGLELVEQSYHAMVERGYPANRCFAAAHRLWRSLCKDGSQAEKAEEFRALTEKHALDTILQDDLQNHDGRTLHRHLSGFVESLPLDNREKFCEAAKAHMEESPFIVNMLVGEYHIDAAWNARGGGYAPEVTDEGWKGFDEHLDLAREHFEQAWNAAPNYPEAATAMIRVAMGSSRSPLSEIRTWFDRAVRAQLDYREAYTNLRFAILPRWHGSHELMYEFAVECMETGRYDTDVPYEFCNTLFSIMQDAHNPLGNRYVLRPGIYENVRTVCQQYIEQGALERNIPWWKTVWLGFAYLSNQWDDAARLLDELNSELDADALGRFPLDADAVIAAIRIHSSPHADAISKAFQAADNGKLEQAADALKAILTEKDLHPAVAAELSSRLQGLDWCLDFQKGEPVSLLPTEKLQGWKTVAGTWSQAPDGAIIGVSSRAGVLLECQAEFGTLWQLSGEIVHGESPYNPWDAGIMLYVDGRPQFSMMFNPTEKWLAAGPYNGLKSHRQAFNPQGRNTKFVMRVEDDIVSVWLNDELVVEDQETEGLSAAASSRVAIGAKYSWAGSTLTFRNLEIKKIEPEE